MHRLRALATFTLLLGACTQAEDPAPAPPPAPVEPAPASAPQVFEVTIASVPSGAAVTLQGAELGVTPYVLKYKRQTSVLVTADGFFAKEITVGPDSDPTVVATLTPLDDDGGATTGAAPLDGPATGAVAMADKPPPTADAKASAGPKPASATSSGAKSASSFPTTPSSSGTATPPADIDKPAPKSSSLPYDNVAAAKADYQAGKINRDTYDQAVRKLKARRIDKLLVIKELYRQGTIDKGEYQRRKRIIDNEYKGV
ncbi:MAG: PEGA domain-containing protein [Deltaproteobacteria bacterium]|nr:PEGA domain-containing protein [Deltaproteobacteria bacterium]